jgi:hypothetical protein
MPSGSGIYKVINDGKSANDFIVQNFNKKSLEFENKTLNQVIGKSIGEIVPGIEKSGLIDAMNLVWKTGQPKYIKIHFIKSSDKIELF